MTSKALLSTRKSSSGRTCNQPDTPGVSATTPTRGCPNSKDPKSPRAGTGGPEGNSTYDCQAGGGAPYIHHTTPHSRTCIRREAPCTPHNPPLAHVYSQRGSVYTTQPSTRARVFAERLRIHHTTLHSRTCIRREAPYTPHNPPLARVLLASRVDTEEVLTWLLHRLHSGKAGR
jgi:hypothetical protein